MDEAAREVEDVAALEDRLVAWDGGRRQLDGGAVLRPGLIPQRIRVNRVVNNPSFGARDLKHEHIVDVVVRREPL